MLLTLFTPTYNRAKHLRTLYASLLKQTFTDFEWIVVDDGSTDQTNQLINSYILDGKLSIRFYSQANAGKHIAMNVGAKMAQGELFFVVDSDDYLPDNSLERIVKCWHEVLMLPNSERKNIIGVAGNISYPSGEIVGGSPGYDVLDTNLINYRFRRKVKGDKCEIYLTSIVKANPFPQFPGETFCPEALVFYRLAEQGYNLRFFNENIYTCEYLEGGLSLNGLKTLQRGPIASLQSYADVVGFSEVPFLTRIKFALLFWRFSFIDKKQNILAKCAMLPNTAYALLYPLGYILHLRDLPKL